jgi:hypothetical protein
VAISTALQGSAIARTRRLVLRVGLCLLALTGCSSDATDGPTADPPSPHVSVPTLAPSVVPTQEPRPEVPGGVLDVSKLLIEAALAYDACSTCSDVGFLVSAEAVTTHAELKRLEQSQRAHLPWAAMQSRNERSQVKIIDIQGEPSKAYSWNVVATGTRTIRTTSATSRSFVQVRLTVVHDGSRWKVARAWGAGL